MVSILLLIPGMADSVARCVLLGHARVGRTQMPARGQDRTGTALPRTRAARDTNVRRCTRSPCNRVIST